jgi:hypothetical protein
MEIMLRIYRSIHGVVSATARAENIRVIVRRRNKELLRITLPFVSVEKLRQCQDKQEEEIPTLLQQVARFWSQWFIDLVGKKKEWGLKQDQF